MQVTNEIKSRPRSALITLTVSIAFISAVSGCTTNKVPAKPALENLGSTSVSAREPADRYDPLVYCGGNGAYRCPAVTVKTEYVAPVAVNNSLDPNQIMRDGISHLAGAPAPVVAVSPSVSFDNILFDFNQSVLSAEAQRALSGGVDRLKGRHIELVGFTDSVGGETYNNALALRRANAVREFLITAGLPTQHITEKGEGLCCYVSSNDSNGNRRLNRRVEIRVKTN